MTIALGVIGTGALGEPIAGRLLRAGFAVSVCDVRCEPRSSGWQSSAHGPVHPPPKWDGTATSSSASC